MKHTVASLLEMKARGEKVSQITCYDYSTARLIDEAGIDTILVGDSLGMTMQGYENTLPVTMEEMIVYGRSVVRGCPNTFVILDMPFMSYQVSVAQAVENAGRLIKETGANAIKLEGGARMAPAIKAMVEVGIPVCAHIGMTPQSVNAFGGFKVQGKGEANAERVLQDALAVEEAGAFMCVLECIPPRLAELITKKTAMVTIGIGGGVNCDGQVLVFQDAMGITQGFKPKFVKHFAEIGEAIKEGLKAYDAEVKQMTYPTDEYSFIKSDSSEEFLAELDKKY